MNRKAMEGGNWNMIFAIVLGIAFLTIILLISIPNFRTFAKTLVFGVDDVENCTGTCRGACLFGEFKASKTCNIDGVKQENKVCCVTVNDIGKTPPGENNGGQVNTNNPPATTPPPGDDNKLTGTPVVEVRLGDQMNTAIMGGSTINMKVGETYKLSVWGAGLNSFNCDVLFYKDANIVNSGFLNGKSVRKALCVDTSLATKEYVDTRKNIIVVTLSPTASDVGQYGTEFSVFNKDGVPIASERSIRISVTQ